MFNETKKERVITMTNNYFSTPKYLAPLDDSNVDEDFSVLTDRATIKYISKKFCDSLHHPVTILDINRLQNMDNETLRIDSDIEYFSLRSSCRLLRHCGGDDRCHICDRYHANIFKKYLQEGGKLNYENPPQFFYDEYHNYPPTVLEGFSRKVLEYHCPMLGYRELLFPIYFEKKLIGILFLGQSIVINSDDDKLLVNITERFFKKNINNPEKIFKNFLFGINDFSKEKADDIKKLIVSADKITEPIEEYLRQPKIQGETPLEQITMVFKDYSEYSNFIEKACFELEKIEDEFLRIFNKKKERYFNKITQEIVSEYLEENLLCKHKYNDLNKFQKCQKELEQEWVLLEKATLKLKDVFGLNDIYLFGDGTYLKIEESKEKHLYPRPTKKSHNNNWTCDFSNLNSHTFSTNDFISSLDDCDILHRVKADVDKENSILLMYTDIAILLIVNDLQKYQTVYRYMAESIGNNFLRIRLSIALSTSNFMKERHVLTLRMNRHESSHISTRLSDNMKRYFSQGGYPFIELDKPKQELVVDDMYNTILLISHMASNIGIITGSINPDTIKGKEGYLDVFDLLYKWQIMFRDRLSDRNLDLIILRENDDRIPWCFDSKFEEAPRRIKTNPELFELLVYNLVDNAVKYAYCGSTIYIRWCCIEKTSQKYMLSVVSFGPKIDDNDRIYELYARGSNKRHHLVNGDGIGLYVVKRIEHLLGLKVFDVSEHISNYHLPLISWYISEPFNDLEHQKKKSELLLYLGKKKNYKWDYVLNLNEYTELKRSDLSREYLDSRIDNETWMSMFNVVI